MRLSRFRPSVLSHDVKFLIMLTALSFAAGLISTSIAYGLGFRPIIDLTVFLVVAVLCYLILGSLGLLRQSRRQSLRPRQPQ